MKRKTFCETESVIKSYMKIVADLLHSHTWRSQHAVENV